MSPAAGAVEMWESGALFAGFPSAVGAGGKVRFGGWDFSTGSHGAPFPRRRFLRGSRRARSAATRTRSSPVWNVAFSPFFRSGPQSAVFSRKLCARMPQERRSHLASTRGTPRIRSLELSGVLAARKSRASSHVLSLLEFQSRLSGCFSARRPIPVRSVCGRTRPR